MLAFASKPDLRGLRLRYHIFKMAIHVDLVVGVVVI